MKLRLLFLSAMIACGVITNAQQLRAGINIANVSVSGDGSVDDANSITSFQVGLNGEFKLGGNYIVLQPGLVYTGKGTKIQFGEPGNVGYYKQSINPFYLELPVNLVFKFPIGGDNKLFAGAGPYIAAGLNGKAKTESSLFTGERDISFSNDDPATLDQEEGTGLGVIRRFDYGLNGIAGIEGKSIVLSAGYGLGLAKLQSGSDSDTDNNNKHRVWSFTLGFKF